VPSHQGHLARARILFGHRDPAAAAARLKSTAAKRSERCSPQLLVARPKQGRSEVDLEQSTYPHSWAARDRAIAVKSCNVTRDAMPPRRRLNA
jgi:hypothetical protein